MSRWPEPLLIDVDTITLNGFFCRLGRLRRKIGYSDFDEKQGGTTRFVQAPRR